MALNGAEVARLGGASISAIVAMVGTPLLDGTNPEDLVRLDALHREQYRDVLGRLPALPSERLTGARSLVLAVQVDERIVGVGFREGDELRVELRPGDDRDQIEVGAAGAENDDAS